MKEHLTDNEKKVLDLYKEEYDRNHSNPLVYVQPKIKIIEDVPASLQTKGYLEISRDDFGSHQEFVQVTLKEKFFKYFNININQ